MISLAGRDILHSWRKFLLTGIGLGLLIGVVILMQLGIAFGSWTSAEGVVMVKLPTLMTPVLPTTMPWGSAKMMLPPIRLPSVSTPLSVPLITTRESCTRLTRLLAPLGT